MGEIDRCLQTRKNSIGNLVSRNGFFSVARWDVARPIANVFDAKPIFDSKKNRGMTMLASAYLFGPKDFHEIARPRLVEVVEVATEPEFVKEPGGAWPICVPTAPDSFAVVLIANNKLIESREIEMKLPVRTQGFDRPDEDQVSRPRAETGERRRRENKKLTRLKVGRGFQANFCEPRSGIPAALRNLFHLLEDKSIQIFGPRLIDREQGKPPGADANQPKHSAKNSAKFPAGNGDGGRLRLRTAAATIDEQRAAFH